MAQPPVSREVGERCIAVIEECLEEGFPWEARGPDATAFSEAARRLDIPGPTLTNRLRSIRSNYGLEPDRGRFVPKRSAGFTIDALPDDGEPTAEELIELLKARFTKRDAAEEAKRLFQVRLDVDGPIGLALFGDPHVDDPGCDWPALDRDVSLCRNTEGVIAIGLGDASNNWVGRLAKLHANQEVTSKQSMRLVEWLMSSIPWLLNVGGNHDCHDPETEALTSRGWMGPDKILDDDQVLSLNPASGCAEWTPILARIDRPNDEEMVSIETSAVSLNVTPRHRMLHRERRSDHSWEEGLKYCAADSLPARFALPVSAPSGHQDFPLSDDWIALTGWFLTDGGVAHKGNSPRVTFYQSKPAPALEAAISGCGLTPTVVTRKRTTQSICGRALKAEPLPSTEWRLSAEQSRMALRVFRGKGSVPSWAFNLSDRQFDLFLAAIIAGDGAWATGGGKSAAIHGTKAFLDSLQAACVAHGWSANLSVAREKDWRLNVCDRREYQADRRLVVRRSAPAGRVWCLTVPHGNFMVRRRGKSHFSGNCWNTEKGDVAEVFSRLQALPGLYEAHGARLQLNLPSGASAVVHVRHDFAGRSQFNPAHAMVRETLFGYRDHILACGHRHQAGYIPVYHNDPVRLCHGMRVGSYKKYDSYAKEKGFKEENWSPAMMAVIDPAFSHDPVRFIRPCFSIEEGCEFLTWRRQKWDAGRRAA